MVVNFVEIDTIFTICYINFISIFAPTKKDKKRKMSFYQFFKIKSITTKKYHMKKLIVLAISALALYSCQEPAKIGFVDNSKLINEYQEKKDLETVFTTRIDGFNKRKDSMQQMFNLELKQAQEKAVKASQKQQQELSVQIQQLSERLDQQIKIEQNRISEDSRTQNDSIVSRIKKFVDGKEVWSIKVGAS